MSIRTKIHKTYNEQDSEKKVGLVVDALSYVDDSKYKEIKLQINFEKDVGNMEKAAVNVSQETVGARDLKSKLQTLRDVADAVQVLTDVKNHTSQEVNDAHNTINIAKEEASKLVKKSYSAKQYKTEPRLVINMYLDYIEATHPGEKSVLEQLRFDQNNNTQYNITNKDKSKDLINKVELESMNNIKNKISSKYISTIKSLEDKRPGEFNGLTKLVESYVDSLKLNDPASVGKPLVIDKPTAKPLIEFWGKIQNISKNAKFDPELEKNPEYLKYSAYAQFMEDKEMSALINEYMNGPGGVADKLNEIVENWHKKGLKKLIINFRKELNKNMESDAFKALTGGGKNGILGYGLKLGKKTNSRYGESLEKGYNQFIVDHANLFLKKDGDGYTEFQKTAARAIVNYYAAMKLSDIANVHSKGVHYEKSKGERLEILNKIKEEAKSGELFDRYLIEEKIRKPSNTKQTSANAVADTSLLGYSNAAEILSNNVQSIPISKLSQPERDDFNKSWNNIEAAKASNAQMDAADLLNVIKYGNKALLLGYEDLLPSGKARAPTKKELLSQLNAVDPKAQDATEKLEKARTAILFQMLLNSSKTTVVSEVKNALGQKEFRELKKKLGEGYINDFDGFTPYEWEKVNKALKKASQSQQGILFL